MCDACINAARDALRTLTVEQEKALDVLVNYRINELRAVKGSGTYNDGWKDGAGYVRGKVRPVLDKLIAALQLGFGRKASERTETAKRLLVLVDEAKTALT